MRLVMDAVKAIEWDGDNLDAVRTFVAPLTLVVKNEERLLLLDIGDNVHTIDTGTWLTRPENNIEGSLDIIDTRDRGKGFRSNSLCILHFSQVKAEFRIELDESDDEVCTTCNQRLFNHTVLVDTLDGGRELEYACPPDPANEIDVELTNIDATDSPENTDKKLRSAEFKKQVFARVAPQASEGELFEFDSTISKIFTNLPQEIHVGHAVTQGGETRQEEAAASLLDAQNDWRK